jgi:hypothetical protein
VHKFFVIDNTSQEIWAWFEHEEEAHDYCRQLLERTLEDKYHVARIIGTWDNVINVQPQFKRGEE